MKTAFCLYGQPRNTKKTLPNIKESWTKHQDIDFFVHAWIDESLRNKPFRSDIPADILYDGLEDSIISTLSPVDFKFQKNLEFSSEYNDSKSWPCHHPYTSEGAGQRMQSHFYSIKSVMDMKRNYEDKMGIKYDCVIVCRFDMIFKKEYRISDYDMDSLNVKNDCTHTSYCLNDQLAMSNSVIMDEYANFFENIERYYNLGIEMNPEVMLGYHIMEKKIQVKKSLGDNNESFVERNV